MMPASCDVDAVVVLYASAARLLLEPDEATAAEVAGGAIWADLDRASRGLGATTTQAPPVAAAAQRLVEAITEVALDAWTVGIRVGEDAGRLRALHGATFGHALSPDHPPYETQYGEDPVFRQPQRLADVSGFYRAFGVEVAADAHERADHLGIELEFMALLTAREATAVARGESDRARVCTRAIEAFLRAHLAPVLPTFARLLAERASAPFYPAVARFAEALCAWDCARRGVAPSDDDRARLVLVVEPEPEEVDA